MINTLIQIILSVFLILIMAFISYSIYNNEYIRSIRFSNSSRKETSVYKGILDYSTTEEIVLETYNKLAPRYVDINPSINQNGGAEYSYNFWICFNKNENGRLSNPEFNNNETDGFNSTKQNSIKDSCYLILFYKGEKNTLPFKNYDYECNTGIVDKIDKRILVKNPLIKIRNDCKEIIVEYNNINFPESYNNSSYKIECNLSNIDDNRFDKIIKERNKNKFGIKDIKYNEYGKVYNMVTIVFQENQKGRDSITQTNTNCRIYLNGDLISDRLANTSVIENDIINGFSSRVMKSNLSKLYINPYTQNLANTGSVLKPKMITNEDKVTLVSPLQVADLSYFNYCLTNYEIGGLYRRGFNKYPAILPLEKDYIYKKGFNFGDDVPKMI